MNVIKQVPRDESVDIRAHSGTLGANAAHLMTVALCPSARANYELLENASWAFVQENLLARHAEREEKDGPAVILADIRRGRLNEHVVAQTGFGYEIDGKLTVEQAVERVADSGLEASLYTTHNHLRTGQEVTASAFDRWSLTTHGSSILTDERIAEYCAQHPRYNHLRSVRLVDGGEKRRVRMYGKYVDVFGVAHQPEHKLRIFNPLATAIPLRTGEYGECDAKAMYHLNGTDVFGDTYSRESANAARLHYLPSHKPGRLGYARHFAGKLLDPQALWQRIIDDRQRKSSVPQQRRFVSGGMEEIKHVLNSVPPDLEYRDWFRCVAAIFHESGGTEDGNALAHEWSSGDPRYDFDQVERIWDSLDPERDKPCTMGTLIKLAREFDPTFKPPRSIRQGIQLFENMIARFRNERAG